MPLQIRRGTEAERQALTSTPQTGELIYITDTKQLFIGDGTNLLRDITPVTGYTDENAADAIGSILDAGPHSGISFVYNDIANTIQATVSYPSLLQNLNLNNFDITGTGNINIIGNLTVDGLLTADYKGSIYADDSTLLVNAVDGKIELDGTVKGNIIPDQDEAYDIGSASNKFRDLYLSGTSLYLGTAQLTSTGSAFNLPAGTTVGGNAIQTFNDASTLTDIQGSVFGDDSTKLVDAVSSEIVGDVNNITVTSQDLNSSVVVLSGTGYLTGQKAGIKIINTGNADENYDLFTVNTHIDEVVGPSFVFERSRGTPAAPVAVQSGDEIMSMFYFAYDSTNTSAPSASIVVTTEGTIGAGIVPSKMELSTADSTGTSQVGLGIDSEQILSVKDNTVAAGVASGEVDDSAAVDYIKLKVGGTTYAVPLYAIRP